MRLHRIKETGGKRAEMNKLFYGDNLDVLRESIKDESVDLIYLDPSFAKEVQDTSALRGGQCFHTDHYA